MRFIASMVLIGCAAVGYCQDETAEVTADEGTQEEVAVATDSMNDGSGGCGCSKGKPK